MVTSKHSKTELNKFLDNKWAKVEMPSSTLLRYEYIKIVSYNKYGRKAKCRANEKELYIFHVSHPLI